MLKSTRSISILILCVVSLCLCTISEGADNILIEEFNGNTYSPQIVYGFKDITFTVTNKWVFGSFIASNLLDIWSTQYALDNNSNLEEGNSLYGSDPSIGTMLVIKIIVGAVVYSSIEYFSSPATVQSNRNWVYGASSVLLTGVSINNFRLGKRY